MGYDKRSVAKKQHRERGQETERLKWGLLEKKKDYKLRAADYHKKEKAIKYLRRKVKERNPDEFDHGMTRRKIDKEGFLNVEKDPAGKNLNADQIKLLKTSDAGYIRTMRNVEQQKIDKLSKDLQFAAKGKHTVFVDDEDEAKSFSVAKYFKTDESLVGRRDNRLKLDQLDRETIPLVSKVAPKEGEDDEEEEEDKYQQLKSHMRRHDQLSQVMSVMDQQRELMKQGRNRKIVHEDGRVEFIWAPQRKK